MTTINELDSLDERIERMAEQLREITSELRHQRESRERWHELVEDMTPLAEQAMSSAIGHLEVDSCDFVDLMNLAHALVRNAAVFESWIGPLRTMSALADELGPLGTPAVASLNARLQQLDERGYFAFARRTVGILDNVVTSFSEEDVKLLGDNIVLILQTVKQMTQPEVMSMLRRTAVTMQEERAGDSSKAPSTLALLRQMRDPSIRRGLARGLAALRSMGAEPADDGVQSGDATHSSTATTVQPRR